MTNETKKPIHKIQVGNGITASIWENSTDGGTLHSVEVERRYKDKESDEWRTSKSYIGAQILLVSKAYEMAFEYLAGLKSEA